MRIFVIDDHSLFRDGVTSLLNVGGHDVVGQAGDGKTALEKVLTLRPDLVLLDINLPEMDGIQTLKEIKAALPETKIVILTISEEDHHIFSAIKAGADGYLLKYLNAQEFLKILGELEHGMPAVDPSIAGRLYRHFGQDAVDSRDLTLSEREIEVLKLVAEGKSNRDVAQSLSISENTIKFHVRKIMAKLNTSNRTETVVVASQKKLI